jgi:uncharacterized protein
MLTAWLHVTNDCNLDCSYCYLCTSSERMDEAVGRAAVEAVVRAAIDHGYPAVKLKYAGGEATMNQPVLLAVHRYARKLTAARGLDLHATLLTNGVALPDDLATALRAEQIKIMISLDGVGDQHDIQRSTIGGKPSFRLVARTIDRLVALGHRPHLSVTVTNRNADGLAGATRFALERELTFSLNLFRDNEHASELADLRYTERTMISALLDSFAVIEEFLPPWSVLGTGLDRGQLLQPRRHACGVGRDYLVVDQRGRVAKCHMNIERTIGDVFHDDPLALVRADQSTLPNLDVEDKETCRACTWRYWCSGGCPVATVRATGRFDVASPNCDIYRAVYPQALRLEGLRILRYMAARSGDAERGDAQRGVGDEVHVAGSVDPGGKGHCSGAVGVDVAGGCDGRRTDQGTGW